MKSHEIEILRGLLDDDLRDAASHFRHAARIGEVHYRRNESLILQVEEAARKIEREQRKLTAVRRALMHLTRPLTAEEETERRQQVSQWLKTKGVS